MMEHHVLMCLGVGQLEHSSFQCPEQTTVIQENRVEHKPSLIFWWSFGKAWLLLNLQSHQPCDKSSSVAHLLDNWELGHEEEE